MKSKPFILSALVALVGFLTQSKAALILGSADSFAVLAGSGITVAGAVNSTTITGDIGTFPTPSITGLGNVVLTGVNHADDAVTQNAKNDLLVAYNDAAGRSATTSYGPIFDLGGLTLTPGVYKDPSSFAITGTLTLDAGGDTNAVWIFQAGSTLITGAGAPGNPGSSVVLINGAQACHVFWQVGSSATIGTYSDFVGNILALTSITVNTGASLSGRALALNGAVTLDNNLIAVPICVPASGSQAPGLTYTVTNTNDSGLGSLRWAMTNANASAVPSTIVFNIPGTAPFTITPISNLPTNTRPATIDATTQPGYAGQPIVELNGSKLGSTSTGFYFLNTSNVTVRGFVINRFLGQGIRIEASSGSVVEGCFIGTDSAGTGQLGNGQGIKFTKGASNNRVGGTNAAARNVISGNSSNGIMINASALNVILGNFIGTTATGTAALANGGQGIQMVNADGNQIGGSTAGAGNVIAANKSIGIQLVSGAGNLIQGNFIGTDLTGSLNLGNLGHGIQSQSSSSNQIGGVSAGSGNTIWFNTGSGISVTGGSLAILGNSIYSNGNLGIDLGANGVTLNDALLDLDTGPNGYQNFPVLTALTNNGFSTIIVGNLNSAVLQTYRIEFFASPTRDASTYGEGRTFLGAASVTTGIAGTTGFSVLFDTGDLSGQFISATATDPFGNTSEFSISQPVISKGLPVITTQPQSQQVDLLSTVALRVVATGNRPFSYQWQFNGFNLAGATNDTLIVSNVLLSLLGNYRVVVTNMAGSAISDNANISQKLIPTWFADYFEGRQVTTALADTEAGVNLLATVQPGEPLHDGKRGGHSMWIAWRAPATGIATFNTIGSSFDTVLAVYTGTALTNLQAVAADDDSGGNFTSQVRFNAIADTEYEIAIDGFNAAAGIFTLNWNLQISSTMQPVIIASSGDQTVGAGEPVAYAVTVDNLLATFQWYFNGQPIPGAQTNSLQIANVQPENVGVYQVRVMALGLEVLSQTFSLQINVSDGIVNRDVEAYDKFGDLIGHLSGIIPLIGAPSLQSAKSMHNIHKAAATDSRGYTTTQIFNTTGATKEPGEPDPCGVHGGASMWFAYDAPATGTMEIDTEASSFDTVLGVYIGPGTDYASLTNVDCNNDAATGIKWSKVIFSATGGTRYYIQVDGVNGAQGNVYLNITLGNAPTVVSQPRSQAGVSGGKVTLQVAATGAPAPRFQWYFNSTPIAVATNSSLLITNFQQSLSGEYYATVANKIGTATSQAADVLVSAPTQCSGLSFDNTGCVNVHILGISNVSVVLQASTNLVTWNPIATNSLPTGVWDYSDTNSRAIPCQFYRAVTGP